MAVLITTTVCVDAQKTGSQVTLHLVRGDAGTRRILFVPVNGGVQIDMANVAQAKVRLVSIYTQEPLLIGCSIEAGKIYMVPTAAMVLNADEFSAQLVLLNSDNETLSSLPFTVLIHGQVYDGDAVEHTDNTVGSAYYDENGQLVLELMDGTKVVAPRWDHTHDLATESKPGFMSEAQYSQLAALANQVNQDVRSTASPTFAGLTVGSMTISGDGTITGLRFT